MRDLSCVLSVLADAGLVRVAVIGVVPVGVVVGVVVWVGVQTSCSVVSAKEGSC